MNRSYCLVSVVLKREGGVWKGRFKKRTTAVILNMTGHYLQKPCWLDNKLTIGCWSVECIVVFSEQISIQILVV